MPAFLAIRFAPNTGDQPMELIVVTDNRDLADVLATVGPSAKSKPIKSLGTLHADLSGASAIAFTVKSITAVATLAKSAWKTIEQFLVSKPKGKLVVKGPFGEIALELANVTEATLETAFTQVFQAAEHAAKPAKKTK
jgi:hypothetical protein